MKLTSFVDTERWITLVEDKIKKLQKFTNSFYTREQTDNLIAEKDCQLVFANLDLTLAVGIGSIADVSGATITVTKTGLYYINAVIAMRGVGAGDAGVLLVALLYVNGVSQSGRVFYTCFPGAGHDLSTVSQQWLISLTSGDVIKLRGYKSGGTGTSYIYAADTTLCSQWQR